MLTRSNKWQAYIDGASSGNPGDAGIGVVIYSPDGKEMVRESVYIGSTTNNVAEYEALKYALRRALDFSAKEIIVYSDSKLLVNQVKGSYKVRDEKLKRSMSEVKMLLGSLKGFLIEYIPREKNSLADKLAKEGIKRGRRVAAP